MEVSNSKDFRHLMVWQEAHKLVIEIYRTTKNFPKEELFGLVSQMRRSAISITSNITEGYGRKSFSEKVQFYFVASGSLAELQNQLLIAKDVQLISERDFDKTYCHSETVYKLLNGLIRKTKEIKSRF